MNRVIENSKPSRKKVAVFENTRSVVVKICSVLRKICSVVVNICNAPIFFRAAWNIFVVEKNPLNI